LTTTDGQPPSWFELSADGRSFVMADAVISGNTVHVSSSAVLKPKFVRMGWNETAIPNLADKNGWPAFAFPAESYLDRVVEK
jgi:sialate O-acetylesterase